MTDIPEPEVNTEDPSISPAKEEEIDPKPPESSPEEPEETDDEPEEGESEDPEPEPTPEPVAVLIPDDGLSVISGETPREHALRLEIKRLRGDNTKARAKEILEPPKAVSQVKVESEVLKKYKPSEIQSLREVLPELAKELGYVRKDELDASSYGEKAQEQIDSFIEAHPEYSPEKDPESVLWNRLKSEYNTVYKPPQNPKDFKKIFERIHKDLFGIQASGPLPKVAAAREKVKVASPAGASAPQRLVRSAKANTGYRFDALKGFSDEDLSALEAQTEE